MTRSLRLQLGERWTVMLLLGVLAMLIVSGYVFAQTMAVQSRSGSFRVGERLTYSVSFENIKNIAFLETYVVSTGKLGGKDVVQLRGRMKTFELVSAAIKLVDETRTVFADPDTGMPVYVSRILNDGPVPKEVTSNFLTSPSTGLDLLTLIYRIRETGGTGNFTLAENGEISTVTGGSSGAEKIKTFAGEFETSVVTLTGPVFEACGIKKLVVNLGTDDKRLPVLIRFKTEKGEYRAELSSIQDAAPPTPTPTRTPGPTVPTPRPTSTPKPQPTATPYTPNQPLLPELAFALGETLDYRITNAGTPVGTLRLAAKERTLFRKRDSLTLTATITGVEQGNTQLVLGDSIVAKVDPDQLLPIENNMKFSGALTPLTQTSLFDSSTGIIMFGGANSVEAPIGTHTLLSLFYAMRSFNLRPSKDLSNPVNDTRVAVFWKDKPYIFTLRPMNVDAMLFDGEMVGAQLVNIITGNAELDQLGMKVWLSTDERRVPLRISIGKYQADLTSISRILPN